MPVAEWVAPLLSLASEGTGALGKHFCRPGWAELGFVSVVVLCALLAGCFCGCGWGFLGAHLLKQHDVGRVAASAYEEYTGQAKKTTARRRTTLSGYSQQPVDEHFHPCRP